MCLLCGDVFEYCNKEECGALSRLDENGKPRWRYFRYFDRDEQYLCEHALARHTEDCHVRLFHECTCWSDDPEDTCYCVED